MGVRANKNVVDYQKRNKTVSKRLRPAQETQELGEHHGRRPPNLVAGDVKGGDHEPAAVPFALARRETGGIAQGIQGDFENAFDFAIRRPQGWTPGHRRDDGVKTESADGNVERRQQPDHPCVRNRQFHFLVCLAQRRLLVCFARFDDAARKRDLPPVTSERARTKREHDVRTPGDGKNQQQTGRVTDAGAIESFGPSPTRLRREDSVGGSAGKGAGQTIPEALDDSIKIHKGTDAGTHAAVAVVAFVRSCIPAFTGSGHST